MVEIRLMKLSDLASVMEIEQSSFPRPWSLNSFITQLARDDSICLVALNGERVIGYVIATQYVEVWHILDIAVHEDHRRRSVASDMLETFLEMCGQEQHRGFTLEVRKSNRGALRMYESFGFICTGLRKGYYRDNGEDALIMWRDSEDMLA